MTLGSRATLGVTLVGCWGASLLSAQDRPGTREGPTWTLRGLRESYCVRFLVEPGAAAKQLQDGFLLLQADKDQSLHPALRGVIDAQPEFASWTPSRVCFFYSDAVDVGERRIAEKDGRTAQLIGIWSIAAVEQRNGTPRDLAVDLFAGHGRLVRAAEDAKVALRHSESSVSPVPETSDREYNVKLGKTRLIWKGRAVGDSVMVKQPIEESWFVAGTARMVWDARMTLRPAWSRAGAGVLSVEGKDALAKALKASPIRFVGPLYRGGDGELRFSRHQPS